MPDFAGGVLRLRAVSTPGQIKGDLSRRRAYAAGMGHESGINRPTSREVQHLALSTSMPGGVDIKGLQWLPRGSGRALLTTGLILILIGGWLAYTSYMRPNVVWSEVASVSIPAPAAASSDPESQRTVDIPVAQPGTYVIVVFDETGLAARGLEPASANVAADYERTRHELVASSTAMSVRYDRVIDATAGSSGGLIVRATDHFTSEHGSALTVYALPADRPPTIVHLPTFRRDLVIVAIGLVLFVVGGTRRWKQEQALRARARAINASLAGGGG